MQRPRFRTDLVSKPVEENGQRFVDVTDPDSGKTFRFYEVEYAVACAMNGARNVGDLVDWARAELGLEPSPSELETVISTLGDLGYLANGANLDVDDLALGSPGRSPMDSGPAARPAAEEFELGVAGRSPMGGPPKPEGPQPAALELGAAGVSGGAPPPAFDLDSKPPQPASPEPQPAAADLSVNLGEHLSIGTDDVKEAVRQSKIMEAVPMPADVMNEMEAPREPQKPPPGATPIELPGRAPMPPERQARQSAPPPPSPRQGSNLTIILLIALLVVAVGLAAYYFFVYAKNDDTEGTKRPRGANNNAPAEVAKPAPAVVSMLKAGEVTETKLVAPKDGKLSWLEAAGTEVSAGAIVAKYGGFEKVADKLTEAVKSRDRYKGKLEKATERDDKKAMAKAAANVERKNGDIAELQEEAQQYVVKAPQAGVVSPMLEANESVKAGQELLKLAVTTGPSASFEVSDASKHEVGDKVEIAAKSDPSLTAVCDVAKVAGNQVSITCPTDSGIDEGAAIVLKSAP